MHMEHRCPVGLVKRAGVSSSQDCEFESHDGGSRLLKNIIIKNKIMECIERCLAQSEHSTIVIIIVTVIAHSFLYLET